jgi:hypothetical protein
MPKYSVEIFREYKANHSVSTWIVLKLIRDKLNATSLTWFEGDDGGPRE